MKKLILISFILCSSAGFAATDMSSKWICSTNASSDANADKTAEEPKEASADESFAHASKNCRDCTKITCEKQ